MATVGDKPAKLIKIIENVQDSLDINVDVYRQGNFTIAAASVVFPEKNKKDVSLFRAIGSSLKHEEDKEDKIIGERIATARALRKLASMITSNTMQEVHKRCQSKYIRPFSKLDANEITEIEFLLQEEKSIRNKLHLNKVTTREIEKEG